ncbi:MAG: ABC transporter ATP-binding protein [Candidatus Magasanikbacteria bacterium]|nr:ABC transporter ATP-binding protein [Candidatus Magasanikbacteria bacterium]
MKNTKQRKPKGPSIFGLLKPYRWLIFGMLLFTIASNGLNLAVPKVIAKAIDSFTAGHFVLSTFVVTFLSIALVISVMTYLQNILQSYASERVARELRQNIADKVSHLSFSEIQKQTSSKLLTNLTSDVDGIKMFVSMGIVTLVSSVFLIIGASILLFTTNWRLALAVVLVLPLVGITFALIFSKAGELFKQSQGVVDSLNKIINESILGAALIRVLNAQQSEYEKFLKTNTEAKSIGMQILTMFAAMIPIVTFVSNIAGLIILTLGGHFVIQGSMSLGDLAAFNSYLAMLIFPIIMIGFMSNMMARAGASYGRIVQVLEAPEEKPTGTITKDLRGDIDFRDVSLTFDNKPILKKVSFEVKAGTRTAIIGPTAAGKTQLLNVLSGLILPEEGTITFDGHSINEYESTYFHSAVAIVFQDSVMFNLSLQENIAFSSNASEEAVQKAIETAELQDFITTLPEGLNTLVSERGTSLSGGQKQRIMLARALALDPNVILLDDFTARVDGNTEARILANIRKNYPHLTLISVTQKIAPVVDYDKILLLMEGELLARGTHDELMKTSPEYVQIERSQRSTNHYEND